MKKYRVLGGKKVMMKKHGIFFTLNVLKALCFFFLIGSIRGTTHRVCLSSMDHRSSKNLGSTKKDPCCLKNYIGKQRRNGSEMAIGTYFEHRESIFKLAIPQI